MRGWMVVKKQWRRLWLARHLTPQRLQLVPLLPLLGFYSRALSAHRPSSVFQNKVRVVRWKASSPPNSYLSQPQLHLQRLWLPELKSNSGGVCVCLGLSPCFPFGAARRRRRRHVKQSQTRFLAHPLVLSIRLPPPSLSMPSDRENRAL